MELIVANWKSHPATEEEAVLLARASDLEGLVICPPFNFLEAVRSVLAKARLGAQDFREGMAVDYAIIGHSDRRREGETSELVAEKMAKAVAAGIIPILCVGETKKQKDLNLKEKVITEEIKINLSLILNSQFKIPNLYIAYEPIWAISTSPGAEPDKPENTIATIAIIKQKLLEFGYNFPVKFLYGGSVTAKNAADFLQYPEIEGALVGAASINTQAINEIYNITRRH